VDTSLRTLTMVIFKDDSDKAGQVLPFSTMNSEDPENLWKYMAGYEEKTGGSVLAIPHNGNLSNGQMFPIERMNGKPIDSKYAKARRRWEPLFEATQMKGDSEAHPLLSPDDEFADYGTWDKADIAGQKAKEDWMLPYEYARSALQVGLQQEQKLGINPYKFGMVGATDSHTGLSTAEEENFFGKTTNAEPAAKRMLHPFVETELGIFPGYTVSAAGYQGVWATENTRQAIFDAMERKETYATTGPRIPVRFFGGWEFSDNDLRNRTPAFIGYEKGVPMGGDLTKAPKGKAPTFIVIAQRDPIGANLDRAQIIKGWMDTKGKTHEKIYDVAVSDDRTIGADGRCKTPVGNTVDLEAANWTNTIGASELAAVWSDPDFDPNQKAFYYVRVLEIPTPRWVLYDKVRLGAKIPKEAKLTHQERAYTSPIWYSP
jgi:hypothetical protein